MRSMTLIFFVVMALSACGPGNVASQIAKPPPYNPTGQTKCFAKASQAEPLIVEWASAARGRLESQVQRGLVVVRYEGCEMQVLADCRPKKEATYAYAGITRKRDRVRIRDEDDLYANLPVGAAKLEAKLKSAGELNVSMVIVGRYEQRRGAYRRDELEGTDCAQATHVVSAVSVGAFDFFAGADADVGGGASVMGAGGGAHSGDHKEMLNEDGDEHACEQAKPGDNGPPFGCGALLRLEVSELRSGEPATATTTATPASTTTARGPEIFDLIVSGDDRYALVAELDGTDVLLDPDGTKFPQRKLQVVHVKGGREVGRGRVTTQFVSPFRDASMTLVNGVITVFASYKVQAGTYAMAGALYQLDAATMASLQSRPIFTGRNWGWFSRFDANGELLHFSFEGYVLMRNDTAIGATTSADADRDHVAFKAAHSGGALSVGGRNATAEQLRESDTKLARALGLR